MLIYRIIHVNNLEYILQHRKVLCPNHSDADPNYVNIGNNTIIRRRSQKTITGLSDQTFLDYIAFYFGPRSIMLYNIHTGFDVHKVDQKYIFYLVYDINNIAKDGYGFFFTDGQAANIPITEVFYDLDDLNKVDMKAAYATNWSTKACQNDPDLKRKKHAEFHIKSAVSLDHFEYIAVCNESARKFVVTLLKQYSVDLPVKIEPSYYY